LEGEREVKCRPPNSRGGKLIDCKVDGVKKRWERSKTKHLPKRAVTILRGSVNNWGGAKAGKEGSVAVGWGGGKRKPVESSFPIKKKRGEGVVALAGQVPGKGETEKPLGGSLRTHQPRPKT